MEIKVFGKPALFHDLRIERSSIPKDLYLYEVRHDETGEPIQIAKGILVNHFGSIITCEHLKLSPNGYLDIESQKDWNYVGGDCRTIKEFQEKYSMIRKKERER